MVSRSIDREPGETKEEYREKIAKITQEAIYNKTGELVPLEGKKDIRKLYKLSNTWYLELDKDKDTYKYDESRLRYLVGDKKGDIKLLGYFSMAWFAGDIAAMAASTSPATGAMSIEALQYGGALLSLLVVPTALWIRSSIIKARTEKLLTLLTPKPDKAEGQLDESPQNGAETLAQG